MQAVRGTRKTWEAGRRAGAQSRSDKADKNDKQTEDAGRITRHANGSQITIQIRTPSRQGLSAGQRRQP